MHEFCIYHLLDHIPSYFIVLWGPRLVCHWFWVFLIIPFHLVLTLRNRFPCFCSFLTFRDLSDIKRTQTFCHVLFLGNRRPWVEEINGGCHEAGKRAHHAGPTLAMWWGPPFASSVVSTQTISDVFQFKFLFAFLIRWQ
jgi:hypothetical protein